MNHIYIHDIIEVTLADFNKGSKSTESALRKFVASALPGTAIRWEFSPVTYGYDRNRVAKVRGLIYGDRELTRAEFLARRA